ncbi:MAG: UDP-N-acetylmuramoyl-L-alanyl-D-glutamate--2,6-diaminopimelate ligase [Bdellovibrio sp.]|nr:UDP-N-acetylmuramoyl-L-alanyl-D-glutamate--2,6-diaminopimelate ligase [Methylotenera sp.]
MTAVKYSLKSPLKAITADSRKVKAGSLFLAYAGEKQDGRQYINDAIKNGASAVLWDDEGFDWQAEWETEHIAVKQLRQQAGSIASQFYKNPSNKMWVIGVTGTNGKTSITQWLSQCFNYLNRKTAVIGTLGNGLPDNIEQTNNTTPDPILLQGMLADYLKQEATIVAMEVSSHGLHQGRVNGVHFDVAVLSNLTRDHLDYHGTFEEYAAAKRRLFKTDALRFAVLNAEDDFGQNLAKELADSETVVVTYGVTSGDIRASDIRFENGHFTFLAITPRGNAVVHANLIGRFNVFNVLAVLATLLASHVSLADAVTAIAQIKAAPGRMQTMGGGKLPMVVIDYAHTPDALEKVLTALKAQARSKLICVFGCGGNRDVGKRALMGKVASDFADGVVVTSDNPRDENPDNIIQDIVHDMLGNYAIEEDRARAISIAILAAKAGDIVLIAGKGHEDYQEIGGFKMPFSDVEQAELVLKKYQERLL